ncbi:MAG TPA: hypothetical protein VFU98_14805 [Microlunatus sp.]|nr:hypothetical protein [Microlunatus sp.]
MISTEPPSGTKLAVAGGATIGAAVLLGVVGLLAVLQGLAAILQGPTFVIGFEYVYKIDPNGWGWIHLLLGLVAVVIAVCLFLRKTWAAVAAIVIAGLSIVVNFMWVPYYPWWSLIVIALDVFIIWAVSVWRQSQLAAD